MTYTQFYLARFIAQVREYATNKSVSSVHMRADSPVKKVIVLGSGGLQIGQVRN